MSEVSELEALVREPEIRKPAILKALSDVLGKLPQEVTELLLSRRVRFLCAVDRLIVTSACPEVGIILLEPGLASKPDAFIRGVLAHELLHAWRQSRRGRRPITSEEAEAEEAAVDSLMRRYGLVAEADALK